MHIKLPAIDHASAKKAYICSAYAAEYYRSVGITIPSHPAGFIAPTDFVRDPQVKPLAFIQTLST